jgi:prepilin-type N-terminal cleavage/methylation domain-containing protein
MRKEAFTLIELLIIIAIIAILAAGIIIAINPGRHFREARNSTRWSHLNAVANAVYVYTAEHHGNYPPCILSYPTRVNITACGADLVPTYMSVLPKDPQEGYHYEIGFDTAAQNRIRLTSIAPEAIDVVIIR